MRWSRASVLLAALPMVHDRREQHVDEEPVVRRSEEVGDLASAGVRAPISSALLRGADVTREQVVLEDEIGEVSPVEVVGVAAHGDRAGRECGGRVGRGF